jgi:hypothetical protein
VLEQQPLEDIINFGLTNISIKSIRRAATAPASRSRLCQQKFASTEEITDNDFVWFLAVSTMLMLRIHEHDTSDS